MNNFDGDAFRTKINNFKQKKQFPSSENIFPNIQKIRAVF